MQAAAARQVHPLLPRHRGASSETVWRRRAEIPTAWP